MFQKPGPLTSVSNPLASAHSQDPHSRNPTPAHSPGLSVNSDTEFNQCSLNQHPQPNTDNQPSPDRQLITTLRTVSSGIGQIMLCEKPLSGALFLAAIACQSIPLAVATVFGSCLGASFARLMNYDTQATNNGLHGFNSALVGLATAVTFAPSLASLILMTVGCICATGLSEWARKRELPVYTAPFIVATWMIFLAGNALDLASSTLGSSASLATKYDPFGVLSSIGQVLFQESPLAGLLCLAGLAYNSGRTAIAGFLGALTTGVVATLSNVSSVAVQSGALGYNAVLTAIALQGRPLVAFCAVVATIPLGSLCAWLGLPTLTTPFVIATACAVLANRKAQKKGNSV